MSFIVLDTHKSKAIYAHSEALKLKEYGEFFRYNNPFERKWALRNKNFLQRGTTGHSSLVDCRDHLLSLQDRLECAFGYKLRPDETQHYDGVFLYGEDDFLQVHLDAGVHPQTAERHMVTVIMYLSRCAGGDLEFWEGSDGKLDSGKPDRMIASIKAAPGRVVAFENDDYAWHGAGPVHDGVRGLITISFMSSVHSGRFFNMRQRAFFAPRPGEEDNPLRFRRADDTEHEEVYRINDGQPQVRTKA